MKNETKPASRQLALQFILTGLVLSLFPIFCAQAQDSTRDTFGRIIIPEISSLKEGASIPAKVFRQYDTKSIGEAIVARIAESRTSSKYTATAFNAFENAQLHYYFSFDDIKPVELAQDGILNIFQVKRKDPYNTRAARQARHGLTADRLAGLRLSEDSISEQDAVNSVRPKYVGLDVNIGAELQYKTEGLDHFGESVAVLKPQVMRRSTYTAFDSGAFAHGYPGTRREVRPLSEPFIYAPKNGVSQYFEAQVWGQLDLGDIQEFLVPKQISKKNLSALIALGLPVYEYQEVRDFQRYRRVRSRTLSAGAPITKARSCKRVLLTD